MDSDGKSMDSRRTENNLLRRPELKETGRAWVVAKLDLAEEQRLVPGTLVVVRPQPA